MVRLQGKWPYQLSLAFNWIILAPAVLVNRPKLPDVISVVTPAKFV